MATKPCIEDLVSFNEALGPLRLEKGSLTEAQLQSKIKKFQKGKMDKNR